VVDQMTNMVMKFDPEGRVALLLGRKAEAINIPAKPTQPFENGAGRPQDVFDRPTDVAFDGGGNLYVADGLGNARVAKFDRNGVFIKSWGGKGNEPGKFATVRSIAIDAQSNVYVADGGNRRIQVFDNNGNFKTQFRDVGAPRALCMTSGATQYLYSSNSNPPNDIDSGGEIYKLKLDGSIVGKFGRAGKLAKEFGTVNEIDCRSDNTLLVGEIGNMRVQRVTLR
jgi:DNA-binding beta-propeller fold protein YncE